MGGGQVRPEKKLDGCLVLQTNDGTVTFPSKSVLLCGECPARSDHVGELPCRHITHPETTVSGWREGG
jgi:hypothetical protein